MDLSYFDITTEEPLSLNSPEQKMDEYAQLKEIADKIGSYRWQYKDDFAAEKGIDTNEHIGIAAQDLLNVKGLDSAVFNDEDGTLKVNTDYLALANLGLIAALARIVLSVLGDNNEQYNEKELPAEFQAGTKTGTDTTASTDAAIGTEQTPESVQSSVDADEARLG